MTSRLVRAWSQIQPAPQDQAIAQRKSAGLPIHDFMVSTPATLGWLPPEPVLQCLEQATRRLPGLAHYQPHSRGCLQAREAIARTHRPEAPPHPDQIFLVPGTSLAYWILFRLLADPGDEVLLPSPGYPLFADLAHMAGIRTRNYPLQPTDRLPSWAITEEGFASAVSPRTRLLAVVAPHNPTGHCPNPSEWQILSSQARTRVLPVLVDEVFRSFTFPMDSGMSVPQRPDPDDFPLLITLDGLSKSLGLPGIKAGWIVVEGTDREWIQQTLQALDHLMDTLLPVSEYAQATIAALLDPQGPGPQWRSELAQRVNNRIESWLQISRDHGWAVLPPQGGWHLVWPRPGPALNPREEAAQLVESILEQGLIVHGGSWYGLPPGWLITSALTEPSTMNTTILNNFLTNWISPGLPKDSNPK